MGTIERIRQISPYAFIAFAVIFILFMVLSDNISSLTSSGGESIQTAVIAEINGDKIYYKDYEERVRQRIEQMRNNPQTQDQEIDDQSIRTQIWNEMVDEILLNQAGKKFGITVTDEEIADILIENPPDFLKQSFTDTAGNFDKNLYLELITNPERLIYYTGQNPDELDPEEKNRQINNFRNEIVNVTEYLKLQKLNEAMDNTIKAAYAISSPSYVEEKYINNNSTADINFIYLGIESVNDSINVTDKEIEEYYNAHKGMYKTKENRRVKTLSFDFLPSKDDSNRVNKRVEKVTNELNAATTDLERDSIFAIKMNEYSGIENDWKLIQDVPPQTAAVLADIPTNAVFGPVPMMDGVHFYRVDGRRQGEQEVVKASHILIGFGNNKDSAKAEANKVLSLAKKGNFAELASKYSEDKGSAAQGGDLGYFGKGRMVPEFEKAAFGAPVGGVVGPIESQFGYHIIKVTDKRSEEIKYSEIMFAPTISGATKNKIKRDAYAAMKQIEDGVNIDTLAAKLGVRCDESHSIQKYQPFQGSMSLSNKIFEAKLNDVLAPQEISNNYVVVCQVSKIIKDGITPLEEVKESVSSKIAKIKKLDILKKRMNEVYNSVKNLNTLPMDSAASLPYDVKVYSAQINNNGAIQGAPTDHIATSAIFNNLKVGKINEPVRGGNGYFIVELKNKTMASIKDKKDMQDADVEQYSRNLFNTWFSNFKAESKIVDKRSKYYGEY